MSTIGLERRCRCAPAGGTCGSSWCTSARISGTTISAGFPFRLYAGGDLSLNRSHGFEITDDAAEPVVEFDTVEKWTVRLGAEWDPSQWGERRIAPFAAADFEVTELTERVATSAVAGVAFRIESIRILLDAEFHDGPSPMGQFRTVDETFWGINATFEL